MQNNLTKENLCQAKFVKVCFLQYLFGYKHRPVCFRLAVELLGVGAHEMRLVAVKQQTHYVPHVVDKTVCNV